MDKRILSEKDEEINKKAKVCYYRILTTRKDVIIKNIWISIR